MKESLDMLGYVWLIPLLPLVGVLINAFLGCWWSGAGQARGSGSPQGRRVVAIIASLAVGASFVVATLVFFEMLSLPAQAETGGNGRERIIPVFSWIVAGDLRVEARILLDQLSILMALVVTGVSTVIHVYSAGYMESEKYHNRYFVWLNLFVLMMLILVLGDSFLTMYVGWEGVGVCSYVLIGYWFEKEPAANAAKKAFLVNRVGDFGFLLGIMLVFATFGSLAFVEVFPAAKTMLPGTATAIALLLFLGATGKSAQIPLHVWLPDAMEGPTPVSALIHAATMVTAGVYMVARCHAIFEVSLSALNWVAWIGAVTALLAATVAMVQKDFKRILAYSTISQLGYMFLGVGVGAYAAGIFHLTTHAFFKALLFLCAGSVMHALRPGTGSPAPAVAGELDIFRMGGLRTKLPWTSGTFLVGILALSGMPLFSGFFSKDAILYGAYEHGAFIPWLMGVVTAGLTAFYAFRLLFVAFYGKSRLDRKTESHVHESPLVMVAPLVILSVLAAIGGYIGLPELLGIDNAAEIPAPAHWAGRLTGGIDDFLHPVFADSMLVQPGADAAMAKGVLISISVLAMVVGLLAAYWIYVRNWGLAARITKRARWLYDIVQNKYYVDEAYTAAIVKPLRLLGDLLADLVERQTIDRLVDGLAQLTGLVGEGLRRLQTGLMRDYALAMLVGVVAVLAYFIVRSVLGF